MTKRFFAFLLVLNLAALSSFALAGTFVSSARVVTLMPRHAGYGSYYFQIDKTTTEPGCSTTIVGIPYNTQYPDHHKSLIATVLLAYSLGKPLQIYLEGCENSQAKVTGIDVLQQ